MRHRAEHDQGTQAVGVGARRRSPLLERPMPMWKFGRRQKPKILYSKPLLCDPLLDQTEKLAFAEN